MTDSVRRPLPPAPVVNAAREVPCNVCGSERRDRLFEKHGSTIVRCRECDLVYVSPRATGEETIRIYQGERYYRNANACAFGYGDYMNDRWLLERIFDARLDEIERHRPQRGRLLDVGCATGVLIELAARRGWHAEGLDVSAYAVAHCRARGLTVHRGECEGAPLTGTYDVIVMDDTLEHLADPGSTLRALHRHLVRGGLLTMNTPNAAGRLHALMGRHWFHYKPQEHLYFFSPATLGRLLDQSGFDVITTRRSGKVVTVAYLCGRMQAYSPFLARLLGSTVARLPIARRNFVLPIGEFAVFATARPSN